MGEKIEITDIEFLYGNLYQIDTVTESGVHERMFIEASEFHKKLAKAHLNYENANPF